MYGLHSSKLLTTACMSVLHIYKYEPQLATEACRHHHNNVGLSYADQQIMIVRYKDQHV